MLGYAGLLATAQVDGNALSNTTTRTSILPPQARFTLPAGYLQFIGQELLVQASGRISTLVTTPGTLTFTYLFQGAVFNSPAFALNAVSKTDVTWWLEWAFTVRGVGSGGSIMHTGFWTSEAVVGAPTPGVGGSGTLLIPASAPTAVATNLGQVNLLDLQATWSVASTSNSIQLQQYRLWSPN